MLESEVSRGSTKPARTLRAVCRPGGLFIHLQDERQCLWKWRWPPRDALMPPLRRSQSRQREPPGEEARGRPEREAGEGLGLKAAAPAKPPHSMCRSPTSLLTPSAITHPALTSAWPRLWDPGSCGLAGSSRSQVGAQRRLDSLLSGLTSQSRSFWPRYSLASRTSWGSLLPPA